MLNPNWLTTFITLVETGHFTKTAEKLFMTQPGVSQHVRKLEEACGQPLILRQNKRFELTEQGRQVYLYAVQRAQDERELLAQLTFDDPFAGRYSIACSGSLALSLYPRLLAVQRQHPKLIIECKAAPNHQILNEIQTGMIDTGIVTHLANQHLFDIREIGCEQLCLVLPATEKSKDCNPQLLKSLGLINHPDAEQYLSLYLTNIQNQKLEGLNLSDIPVSGYINQISQILQPVANGLGFTVLPKSAVDSFENTQQLYIDNSQPPVMEKLYWVKKKHRPLPARFDTVNTTLERYFNVSQQVFS